MKYGFVLRLLFISFLTLFIWESVCRLFGIKPILKENKPFVMLEPWREDKELGYANQSGRFRKVRPDGAEVFYTINNYGNRITPLAVEEANDAKSTVVFAGDSYTFGVLVKDEETLPAQVQFRKHDIKVVNLGVGGYSLCQIYLSTMRYLRRSSNTDYVIYPYLGIHNSRGIWNISELWRLAYNYPNNSTFQPICEPQVGGKIRAKEPLKLKPIFGNLIPHSSLAVLMNDLWLNYRFRSKNHVEVIHEIIKIWNHEVLNHGAKLIILITDSTKEESEALRGILLEEKIPYLNLHFPESHDDKYRVIGDGHPNALLYSKWGEEIVRNWNLFSKTEPRGEKTPKHLAMR